MDAEIMAGPKTEDFESETSTPRKVLTLREKTQQAKEIKDILKSGMTMEASESLAKDKLAKKLMTLSNPLSTSIIRIVPGDIKKVSIPKKGTSKKTLQPVKMVSVKMQNTTSPTTSASAQLMDHSYLKILKSKKTIKKEANELQIESFENEDIADLIEFNNSDCDTKDSEIKPNPLKRILETTASTIPKKIQRVHGEQCCCACRESLNVILQQQQEILKILRKDYSSLIKLDLLPNMPFDDLNDFLDFDESLTHENVRDQFVVKMKKLLVGSDQKSVSNIMSSILTNELCKNITWIGVKNSLAFGTTNMVEMIIDIIQEHHCLDIDSVKTRIAEWLRRCGDRIGNEIRKNKRRAEFGYAT